MDNESNAVDKLLQQGIAAAKAGRRGEARQALEKVLEQDDSNEQAWLVLASVVETPRERRICLENVLEINPNNERARQALERLKPSPPSQGIVSLTEEGGAKTGAGQSPATSTIRRPPPVTAPTVRAGEAAGSATKEAWRRQRNPNGVDPQILFFVLLGVTVIGVGILLATGGFGTAPLTPTPVNQTPTRVVQQSSPTVELIATRVTIDPNATSNPATWTPIPTNTPAPTNTPPATLPPLAGYRLVYSLEREGVSSTRIVNGDGSRDSTLTDRFLANPSYSPDGRKIAYTTIADGSEQIAVANADGSEEVILTKVQSSRVRSPAWSPDGKRIAFVASDFENDQIYLMNADGTNVIRYVSTPYADIDPAFSPDGKTLVFTSDTTGRQSFQIFALPVENDTPQAKPVALTNSGGQNTRPVFSPDGRTIAFISTRSRSLAKIYLMRADGSDERPLLVEDGNASNADPAWSPDGLYLAYASNRNGGQYQLFIVPVATGRNAQQVTNQNGNVLSVEFRPGF
ncbi:MAG TPA: hypothetical protein PLD47_15085 [Aggregatilineales bacterium]|nr:PD40 domain-containing protein [Anaerolineales bacterium]HRE49051.1 hypothetical protein [Aggregatilineales bacterium]